MMQLLLVIKILMDPLTIIKYKSLNKSISKELISLLILLMDSTHISKINIDSLRKKQPGKIISSKTIKISPTKSINLTKGSNKSKATRKTSI